MPALEYLLFAKQCEPYVTLDPSWYYEYETALKERRKPGEMQRLIDGGLTKYRKTGRKAESLVLASLIFDQKPALMDEAFIDFNIPLVSRV